MSADSAAKLSTRLLTDRTVAGVERGNKISVRASLSTGPTTGRPKSGGPSAYEFHTEARAPLLVAESCGRTFRLGAVQKQEEPAAYDTHSQKTHGLMPDESSAYPEPSDFEVMRPSYHEHDDGFVTAKITISPFSVEGESSTKAGARRAALYEARKTYASYHPNYDEENPFPEHFVDRQGTEWELLPPFERSTYGDYRFTDDLGEEDYVDIETMLMWDVRPDEVLEDNE